jgi:hypothetical protein
MAINKVFDGMSIKYPSGSSSSGGMLVPTTDEEKAAIGLFVTMSRFKVCKEVYMYKSNSVIIFMLGLGERVEESHSEFIARFKKS